MNLYNIFDAENPICIYCGAKCEISIKNKTYFKCSLRNHDFLKNHLCFVMECKDIGICFENSLDINYFLIFIKDELEFIKIPIFDIRNIKEDDLYLKLKTYMMLS